MINRIFCDLDGVIVNFTKDCCKNHGVEYPKQVEFSDQWLDTTCDINHTDPKKFLTVKCHGHDFWANLEIFPWAYVIIAIVKASGREWRFLTKPTQDAGCYSGKYDWIKKYFPEDVKKLWIVNGDKSLVCRGKGDLLIDDKLENLNTWKAAGGSIYHWTEITPDWPKEKVQKRLDELHKIIYNPY